MGRNWEKSPALNRVKRFLTVHNGMAPTCQFPVCTVQGGFRRYLDAVEVISLNGSSVSFSWVSGRCVSSTVARFSMG